MDYDLLDQSTDRGFLHFWGIEGVEEGVRGGATVGEFWGGGV